MSSFSSASEVVCTSLRQLEENEIKLALLRDRLSQGEKQANRGEFSDYSIEGLITELNNKDNNVDT